jgi:hypothetical protein
MIVALLALVFAVSGTAIAAGSLVNGNSLIKKHSLSGNRLRNHTLTGTQINLKKLGKVPSAKNADHATTAGVATSALSATSATNATNATNAVNATNAGTAANLSGLSRFIKTIQPAGTTAATANTVTLGTSGPLTVYGVCYLNSGDVDGAVYLSSTVAGFWNSYYVQENGTLAANTPVDLDAETENEPDSPAGTPDYLGPYDGTFSAITGTLSNYITGLASVGVNLTSANGCTFAGFTSAN